MKIIVYLDEEDLISWKEVKDLEILSVENKEEISNYNTCKRNFWKCLLDKYTILRNKQIYINPEYGCVYDISGRI